MIRKKRKIFWLTPDYFFDVDAYIVPHLMKEYEIDWVLINSINTNRNSDGIALEGERPRSFNLKYRQKDPRVIFQYLHLLKQIKRSDPDLLYLSFEGTPYFFFLLFLYIKPSKVIYGTHNVSVPKGAANEWVIRLYYEYGLKKLKNFHVFSKFQQEVVKRKFPGRNYYYAPLALKNFGASSAAPPEDKVRFLFFGYIRDYKRLDLLIEAFQLLYKEGFRNTELVIAGGCENWTKYENKISVPEAIKTRIEVIPNADIPELISSCHYFVLPYQDGTQSGVLSVAYQYNKPVIASDIDAFQQFVKEGYTGYYFKSSFSGSLLDVMRKVVSEHSSEYPRLVENVSRFAKEEFSLKKIVRLYCQFLDTTLADTKTHLEVLIA